MNELIIQTAQSVERQLAAIAVELAGGPIEAASLLRSISEARETPLASNFLQEAGALLRARRYLADALQA
jgi:hypothetical protein